MYILFLIFAAAFLLLKTGLLSINMNINLDLLYFNIPPLKLIVRISPVTICLAVAWFTGLNQQMKMPALAAMIIIFVVLPSLYETVFGKTEKSDSPRLKAGACFDERK